MGILKRDFFDAKEVQSMGIGGDVWLDDICDIKKLKFVGCLS